MDRDYIQAYCVFHELKSRSVTEFAPVWTYSNFPLRMLPIEEFDKEVNVIIEQWFEKLPQLYSQTYENLFETNK